MKSIIENPVLELLRSGMVGNCSVKVEGKTQRKLAWDSHIVKSGVGSQSIFLVGKYQAVDLITFLIYACKFRRTLRDSQSKYLCTRG